MDRKKVVYGNFKCIFFLFRGRSAFTISLTAKGNVVIPEWPALHRPPMQWAAVSEILRNTAIDKRRTR